MSRYPAIPRLKPLASSRACPYGPVLAKHGRKGFGLPSKAPCIGSFPLYPLKRARYALAIVAGPAYRMKPAVRGQVARRAVAAHPELRAMARRAGLL